MGILLATTFWEVIWYLIIIFFGVMVIWMFIAIFADIFSRRDLSGWGKAGWTLVIFLLPLLGILIYVISRPVEGQADVWPAGSSGQAASASATEDIAKAQQMLQAGTITQVEFDAIKRRALA